MNNDFNLSSLYKRRWQVKYELRHCDDSAERYNLMQELKEIDALMNSGRRLASGFVAGHITHIDGHVVEEY